MSSLFILDADARDDLNRRFEQQITRIRVYAWRYFCGHREQQRLIDEVIQSVLHICHRKFDKGHRMAVDMRLVCLGVLAGYFRDDTGTITNPGGKRYGFRARNDSRFLRDVRARGDRQTVQLDVKNAIRVIGLTKPVWARILMLAKQGFTRDDIIKRLHASNETITKARIALRDLLADYAEA